MAGWRTPGQVWLGGGKTVHGQWKWHGRVTTEILVGAWAPNEPSGNGHCLIMWHDSKYLWDDVPCNRSYNFVCERNAIVSG